MLQVHERAEKKSGAREQYERKRDFGGNQSEAEARSSSPGSRSAISVLQRFVSVAFDDRESWSQAK